MVQYAALLGPWPAQVPGSGLQHQEPAEAAGTSSTHSLPPAAAAALLGRPEPSASLSSIRAGAPDNVSALYHAMLYPQVYQAAAAAVNNRNHMTVVLSSQSGHLLQEPSTPTGQLLLWYFVGLAAVQPVVLWLQAAALAVVLNVLRHMPEQQLRSLLGNGQGGSGRRQSAVGAAETCAQGRQGCHVFLPLSYAWRAQWTWMDWLRFRLLKHSLDIVLVRPPPRACLYRALSELVVVDPKPAGRFVLHRRVISSGSRFYAAVLSIVLSSMGAHALRQLC